MLNSAKGTARKAAASAFSGKSQQTAEQRKKRPSPLTLRLSDEELRAVRSDAEQHGLSVSAYVRAKVFGGSGIRKNTPAVDKAVLGRLLGLLGQSEIADSLKVMAYEARCGSLLLDEETLGKIEAAYAHVCYLRKTLVAGLGVRETPRS